MRRWRVLAMLPVVTATLAGAAQQSAGTMQRARAAMLAGMDAANKGDLATAESSFERAVRLEPGVAATHAALGAVLLGEDKAESAGRELEAAHRLAADDVSVDLNLARTDVKLGRTAQAVTLFEQALRAASAPELSAAEAVAYATALAAQGSLSRAEGVLRAAAKVSPDSAEVHDALGTLLAQQGGLEAALPEFRQAVQLDGGNASARFHLGVALLGLNEVLAAVVELQRAAAAMPGSYDAHLQLGRALSAAGQDSEALRELHTAVKLQSAQSDPRSLYPLALALQASGDAAGSLPVFAEATREPARLPAADYSAALTNYALAEVQTGDAKDALLLYARALALGPDTVTLREDYGAAYLQQSDLIHAMEQFRAGLALDPKSAHLHYDLGLALKLRDDLKDAVPEFEQAAALDPALPDPAYTLGVIYMQQGRFAEAAVELRRAVTLQPDNGDAWGLLGSVLRESDDLAGATDALRHALALEPDQPSLHVQMAALEVQAGQKDEAAAERRLAAELSRVVVNRQRASFSLKSGRALLAQNNLTDALVQLRAAAQADPGSAEVHTLLAEVYARQGKSADAAVERSKAAELASTAPAPVQ